MKILIAHDGSQAAGKALTKAADLAAKSGASLTVLMVIPDLCLSTEEISLAECDMVNGSLASEAKGLMNKALAGLKEPGVSAEALILGGRPVDVITGQAKDLGADLIVIGSRGRHGTRRFLLGSVSAKVAEYAECDVLIVKS